MRTQDPELGTRAQDSGPGNQEPEFETLDPRLLDPKPRISNRGPLEQFRVPNTYSDMLFRTENGSDRRQLP